MALTFLVGALGAALAWIIQMPMGLLAGPAIAVATASLMGMHSFMAKPVRDGFFLIAGLTVGSMVTPTSLGAIMRWPIAFACLAVLTIVTPFLGRFVLTRFLGFDRDEAFLASAPGHLSLVVSLSDSLNIPLVRPAILASMRVLLLTLLVPVAAGLIGIELGLGLPMGRAEAPWGAIAVEVIAAMAVAPLLQKLRLPAPILLGGMLVGAAGHVTGLVEGNLPGWVSQIMLIAMGTLIGTRFSGVTFRQLLQNMGAGVLVVVMTATLPAGTAAIAAQLTGLPFLDMLVGFAPGALDTMIVAGIAVGADPTFVAAAHVGRLILLALVITAYAARITRRRDG